MTVRVTSIDEELERGLPAPNVVKIDVEGLEIDVIRGMSATIENFRQVLVCELHGSKAEFASLMQSMPYELRTLSGSILFDAPDWDHVVARPLASA